MGNSTVILKKCKLLSINDCQPTNSKFSIADTLQVTRFSSLFIWGALGIYLLVAWWSLSFKFTWYFRSKEVKFIRGHIMEDIMGFGTIFFPSSWISNRDPHSRNIISPIDSSEKLPSSIPAASVYSTKSASSREIFSLGTDRVQAKQTRSQERVKLIPKVKFFYSPSGKNFFPVSCLWMKEE